MVSICTLAFFAAGCEHSVATWLSMFGMQERKLGEETMAIMTSNFWTAMSVGRVAWAFFAGYVTSAWPAMFANTICCVVGCLCMFIPSHALLWSSAMVVGLGVASSFPAAITLPAEMGITMTPRMMTTLQLTNSFGEMFCPYLMGLVRTLPPTSSHPEPVSQPSQPSPRYRRLSSFGHSPVRVCVSLRTRVCFNRPQAFQYRVPSLFYKMMLGWQSFVLLMLVVPWMMLTRRIPVPAALLRALTGVTARSK